MLLILFLCLGLDVGAQSSVKQSQTGGSGSESGQSHASSDGLIHQTVLSTPHGHWGENRLADVVKGTAKSKGQGGGSVNSGVGSKESSSAGETDSPRAISPQNCANNTNIASTTTGGTTQCNFQQVALARQPSIGATALEVKEVPVSNDGGDIQLSTVTLTPPTSPEK